jgi:hypothetical protein
MRFRYLRDPLFLFCLVLYFANRFVVKRFVPDGFVHDHLNDLICIPFWVPIMIFLLRKVGLRRDDGPPRAEEILVPLVMWSAIFELYLPHTRYFEGLATADHVDILWYTIGALAASVVWGITYRGREQPDREPDGEPSESALPTSLPPEGG